MAIMRTGYMDHEAGEVMIGQGYEPEHAKRRVFGGF